MSFEIGNSIKLTIGGASHSASIKAVLEGFPVGEKIDLEEVNAFLKRRQGGKAKYTTPRKEKDEPVILSGLSEDGIILNGKIEAEFINSNVKSEDYKAMRVVPRPSHADYVAYRKYNGSLNMAGGGFFSGRMTLPMCFGGAVAMQLLEKRGIKIRAHILSVGEVMDTPFDAVSDSCEEINTEGLPVINPDSAQKMTEVMEKTAAEMDSIGGVIECKVTGMPVGIGDPVYDSLESIISYGMFGIPAIKGIEFGRGFDISKTKGSESNDAFIIVDGEVRTKTNNSGGIQGGISNGMPIIFRVAVKPTPSIFKEQQSVDLITMTETTLKIEGRHDSCIVPRVVPCVEAMCALMLFDAITFDDIINRRE